MKLGWGLVLIITFLLGKNVFASCNDPLLTGYDHIVAFKAEDEAKSHYHIDNIDKLDLNQIENLRQIDPKEINGSGSKLKQLYLGEVNGHKVLIKICDLRLDHRPKNLTEASFTKLMSDLGLGPRFHGVVVENGKPTGIITDFIEGHSIKHHILYTRNSFRALVITNTLASFGLNTSDLQYRVDLSGRYWIVDTGLYNLIEDRPLPDKDRFSAQLLTLLQKLNVQ